MKGYQADIDSANQFTGQIYEERGRGFLAMRGQVTYIRPTARRRRSSATSSGRRRAERRSSRSTTGTRRIVIARGNTIIEILNGHVTSILVDDDAKGRALSGLIGFQMHVGEPMKVEFRNIWLKKL